MISSAMPSRHKENAKKRNRYLQEGRFRYFVIFDRRLARREEKQGREARNKGRHPLSRGFGYLFIGIEQVSETIFMLVTFICIMPLLIPVSELPELIAPPEPIEPPDASMCCIVPITVTVCPTWA
jgi:hypothetical protein